MNPNILIILLLVAVWGTTIIFVAWDTQRRGLAEPYRSIWRLVALIPLLGFAAYLVAGAFLPPGDKPPTGAQPRQRVTFLKREAAPKRLSTIPAAEYLRAAQPGQPRAARKGGHSSYTLVVAEGPHAGEKFVVDQLPACIGRGPGCEMRLDDDRGVSRRHAELYRQAGQVRLRDLASTHGTTVNGNEIDDKGLTPGDQIRLGYSLLIFKMESKGR